MICPNLPKNCKNTTRPPRGVLLVGCSLSMSGEHHVTFHNMGMSYFYLGKLKLAKECFEHGLKLDEASFIVHLFLATRIQDIM